MKIIFTIISIQLLVAINATAQDQNNFVKNPSFETLEGKLKKPGQINIAQDWFSPTALKADLFSKSKQGPIGVPENDFGKEFAKDGDNYAGVVAYSYNNNKPRTYLQAQLSKSLLSGVDYCIKFSLSLSDLSKYAIDKIGIHISPDAVSLDRKGDIIFTERSGEFSSVITGLGNKVYSKRYNWETVCGIYHAEGKEKFITIGNFYNGKDTKSEKLKKLPEFSAVQFPEAYYYIDNVEVLMISDETECDCVNSTKKKKESVVYQSSFVDNGAVLTVEQKLKRFTVYFDVESSDIEKSFKENLDKITALLKENINLSIQINGHTDKAEKEAINDDPENDHLIKLGMYRANNIKKFLTSNGIEAERLSSFDAGSESPASAGLSRLSLAKSRRVEFIITK